MEKAFGSPVMNWFLLFVVAGALAGGLWWLNRDRECRRWQQDYRSALEADERPTGGVFDFVNQGPSDQRLNDLRDERPGGCRVPESP